VRRSDFFEVVDVDVEPQTYTYRHSLGFSDFRTLQCRGFLVQNLNGLVTTFKKNLRWAVKNCVALDPPLAAGKVAWHDLIPASIPEEYDFGVS
jgi:hypothetical protein